MLLRIFDRKKVAGPIIETDKGEECRGLTLVKFEFWSYRFGAVNLLEFLGDLVDNWMKGWN